MSNSSAEEWFEPLVVGGAFPEVHPIVTAGVQSDGSPISAVPTSVKFWHAPESQKQSDQLYGVTFTYSDGSQGHLGAKLVYLDSQKCPFEQFQFQAGERLTSMKMIEGSSTIDGAGGYMNTGVSFETQFGRKFECNFPQPSVKHSRRVDVPVGSGLLLGGQANDSGGGMTTVQLSYYFLKPVQSLFLKDVSYTSTPTNQNAPINLVTYLSKHFSNGSSVETNTWSVSESHTDTQSFSWTVALAVGLSMTASVSAGIFDLVEVNDQFTWSIDASVSHTTEETESKAVTWTNGGQIGPRKQVDVTLSYGKGSFTLSYKGTLVVTMKSGATWTAPVSGPYAQTAVGVGQIETSEHSYNPAA